MKLSQVPHMPHCRGDVKFCTGVTVQLRTTPCKGPTQTGPKPHQQHAFIQITNVTPEKCDLKALETSKS